MKTLPLDLENKTGKPSGPFLLTPSRRANLHDPAGYQPDNDLVSAIEVALLLRKPLLVTGEPGTGKTDLGRYLAWKMNYLFFQFDSKSNSVSRDLYYAYDSLGRFQAAQSGERPEPRNFIRFNALGAAILESKPLEELSEAVRNLLPDGGHHHRGPRQSVVVIDEIDKTPRDFPNDLLNELDQNFFRIPELGIGRVEAKEGFEPILVITSNSEKNLPAPFVRRCVYYHIEFPIKRLKQIVASRIADLFSPNGDDNTESPLLDDALEIFLKLRADAAGLTKKPATAELLDWLLALLALGADRNRSLAGQNTYLAATLPALIKQAADRTIAAEVIAEWLKEHSRME